VSETPIHNLLTVKETAEYLRIPSQTVYYLVHRGKIPAVQIGGRWRVKKSALDHEVLWQDKQGRPTVLVVDDDLSLQDLFRLHLRLSKRPKHRSPDPNTPRSSEPATPMIRSQIRICGGIRKARYSCQTRHSAAGVQIKGAINGLVGR
jgi:excisionase family DNA binding protein